MAELIAARVDLVRLARLLSDNTPPGQVPTADVADAHAVARAVAAVDRAATVVARGLR